MIISVDPDEEFLEWVKPVTPFLNRSGAWLCGGSCRDCPNKPKDWDIFFSNEQQYDAIEKILASGGTPLKEKSTFYQRSYKYNGEIISLIRRKYYASIEEVLKDFDFTINQIGYDGTKIWQADCWASHKVFKKLIVVRPHIKVKNRIWRLTKFLDQGYTIDSDNLMALFHDSQDRSC